MMEHPGYQPHPGVDCCPCVPRLRQQNHDAAAERDKQHRQDRSDLDGLRHLMTEGLAFHRKGHIGISAYGQAALAEALRIADEAEAELDAIRVAFQRERRARIVAEDTLRKRIDAEKRLKADAEQSGSFQQDGATK